MSSVASRAKHKLAFCLRLRPEIMSSKQIKKASKEYLEQTKAQLKKEISSDIAYVPSYMNNSRAIEAKINELAGTGKYHFGNMLIIKNPYQYSPMCALAVFYTKKPYAVKVTVKGKTSDVDVTYTLPKQSDHRVPIMGMYMEYKNTVTLQLLDENDRVKKEKQVSITIGSLGGKNSKIRVKHEVKNDIPLYPLTLVYGGGDDGIYPYAYDRNGELRFCFSLAPKTYGFQPISHGRFLFLGKDVARLTCTNPTATQLYEVDQMGRFVRVYEVEKGIHHDFAEMENGNIVAGSNAVTGQTFEDAVVEIDRKTGDILMDIDIKDYIDKKYADKADWAHLNTVQCDHDRKTVMVCLRNLHAVINIDYEKKELKWIIGHPKFWEGSSVADKVLTPIGDMEWFFQAHAAYMLEEDLDGDPTNRHMIIYDNHRQMRQPVEYYDNVKKSFVRIYTIDEEKMTVELYKSFPCRQATIRSNAVLELKAGRIMAMSGKVQDEKERQQKTKKGTKKYFGQIIEFDYNTGEVINLFSVNHGYYRAYEFKFASDDMSKPLNLEESYVLGTVYGIERGEAIDVKNALTLPKPVLEECDATEKDRAKRLELEVAADINYYVDPKQDMARIKCKITDGVLYVSMIDHLLDRLYFVGQNHTYYRDYTDTKQERSYFARGVVGDPVPLRGMEEDVYKIYYMKDSKLYISGHSITIKNV